MTAWNLMPELVPQAVAGNRISCGLQLAWDPFTGILAGAGDTKETKLKLKEVNELYRHEFNTLYTAI